MDTLGEPTKERILAATIRLLERDGWDAVTVRRIGAEADVNIALVNYHFGSKMNLMLTALETALNEAVVAPAGSMRDGTPADDWLGNLVRIALGPDFPSSRRRVFESALAAALHDRDLAARMRPMLDRSRKQLAARIGDAVADGELPASTDVEALAVALTALLDGLWLQRTIDQEIDVDRVTDAVTSLLGRPHD